MNNNNSGVNTILLVLILVIIVGFGVWYWKSMTAAPAEDSSDFNVEVKLPDGGEEPQPPQ